MTATETLTPTTTPDAPPAEESCQACGWTPEPGELWPSEGKMACRWIEDNLILAEGDWYGKPFRLRKDQRLFIWEWFEYCPDCGEWHYNEALWGAATGDGKTALVAAIVAVSFAGPPEYVDKETGQVRGIAPHSPNIPVSAASWEQADLLFGCLKIMFGGTDDEVEEAPLRGMFEVYDAEIKMRDGVPGRAFRTAAVAGTNEGGLPTLYVQDELHEWGEQEDRKGRVATVISKSTLKRRTLRGSGRILALSTAGFDVDKSLLGAEYKRGKRRLRDWRVAPRFLFRWAEAPDGLDWEKAADREIAVRAASNAAGIQWSVRDRVALWGTPKYPRHEWIRYFGNRWVDIAEDSWLKDHPTAWPNCRGSWTASDENPWALVVDMALRQDSVSVGRVEQLPDDRFAFTARIWNAEHSHNGKIDHGAVWDYIVEQARGSGFRGVVYDPRFFEVPARLAEDEHNLLMVEFPQTVERMQPACGLALQMIVNQRIVHADDPDVNLMVTSAVPRWQERGFTLAKGRSKRHIDAAITLVMGLWHLHGPEEEPPPAGAPSAPPAQGSNDMFRPTTRLQI